MHPTFQRIRLRGRIAYKPQILGETIVFGRNKLLLLGVGLLILVGVVLVAFLIPGESITRFIAVAAFVTTLSKIIYDVWDKERERLKKAEDKKEKIKATPVFNPIGGKQWLLGAVDIDLDKCFIVGVELYNEGVCSVNIKKVSLCITNEHGQIKEIILVIDEAQDSIILDRYEDIVFVTPGLNTQIKGTRLVGIDPNLFYIQVDSHLGTVARVDGKSIQEVITKAMTTNWQIDLHKDLR
jgi:hypothetical protein